ncbi:MAG: signal peptidase I [Lachnospiraceae bacterium]|nr:signal peptidase I [Lachnospiraceae bacterium]
MKNPLKKDGLNFNRKRRKIEFSRFQRVFIFLGEMIAVVLLSYFVVISYGIRIDSLGESMEPTLQEGDVLLMDKLKYRLLSPSKNDIIAFQPSGNLNSKYSIKRVIGLPGDLIKIENGTLYVNNEAYRDVADTESIKDAGIAENEITVPSGSYFVLGDNRNNSEDSRYETIGMVRDEEIVARIWFDLTMSNFGFVN